LELTQWGARLSERTVSTIFLGGGTPTVLEASHLVRIFQTVRDSFRLSDDCEITSEANPGTVDRAKFALLTELGVNRLSMGVQSFQDDELLFLGRIHNSKDVTEAYDAARSAGFRNINLDFMFGLPHQPVENWKATLEQAVALQPEHLSLYSLIVEPNTPLHHWVSTGLIDAPDDDEAATLYEIAIERLARADYVHYEVSNWARNGVPTDHPGMPAYACQHNLIYWRNQEYLGVGPGAHSHLTIATPTGDQVELRWGNRKPVPSYIQRIRQGESIVEFQEEVQPLLAMGETMMLGLRLLQEGVSFARFQERHGLDMRQVFQEQLDRLNHWGLLEIDATGIRLSQRGLMLGNQVFAEFLPDAD
jgi:oxygen-independent coproporphyrinogen-3 oxidase